LADLLGPSGQPLPSNPLLSQSQGPSSTASIDTGSAKKAFTELQKVLDDIMKSFGGNWEKITNDRLKAEERFYRAVGDKAKERQIMLQRYSQEAIDAIENEKRAHLDSLNSQKLGKEELEKRKTDITRKAAEERANVEKETAKKLAQDRGIGGIIRGKAETVSQVLGGGTLGGLVTGAADLIANPAVAIPAAIVGSLLEMGNTAAAFNRTGSQLAGAGFGLGTGGATGMNFATSLFGPFAGRLGQALGADQQREIIGMMAGSRTMIDQARAGGGFGAIRGNLGLFANILPDATKEMELFTDATKTLGMSQRDITSTFVSSRVNAERLKITQLDAINVQIEMQKALRNITNDGAVAASVLSNITDYLNGIGASEAEKARIGLAVGQAGASLSLSSIAGMFAFTHGGRIPGPNELFGPGGMLGNRGTGTFGLLGSFLTQVGSQFRDPTQRMFAADQLRQQFLPGLRLQDIPKFFDLASSMMKPGANIADFEKQFRTLESKTPQVAMSEGIDRLSTIVAPIQRIENVFTNFWTMLDERWNKLLDAIHNPLHLFHINMFSTKDVGKKPSGQSGRHSGATGSF
jgi:hypothetical protein